MQIYSVVNVENLRLYEPPLIEDQGEKVQIPSIEDFSLEYLDELQQDTILDRRTRTSKRGSVDYLRVGLKDTNASKAKWIEIGKVRELYPHLSNNWKWAFGVQKLPVGRSDQVLKIMLKNENFQNGVEPEWPRRSYHSEFGATHFAENQHRMQNIMCYFSLFKSYFWMLNRVYIWPNKHFNHKNLIFSWYIHNF